MSFTLDQVTTVSDFAQSINVTAQTVAQWFDKAGADAPNPVKTLGRVRLFLNEDMERLAADNASGASMRAMGYVHPQKYAELESRVFELINEKTEACLENDTLRKELAAAKEEIIILRLAVTNAEEYTDSIIEG